MVTPKAGKARPDLLTHMNEQSKPGPEQTGGPPEGMTGKEREAVLLEMAKTMRAMSMYPASHPQRENITEQAAKNVQAILGRYGDMSLKVSAGSFSHEDEKLGSGHSAISELAKEMHLRQVKSFSLRKELLKEDFQSFLEMLFEDPEKFRQGKYIEQWIKAKKIGTVWLNEIDFKSIIGSAAPVDDEVEEPEPEGVDVEANIRELLNLIDNETDPDRFTNQVRELELLAGPLLEEEDYERLWIIAGAIGYHATEDMRPGPEGEVFRAIAKKSVAGLAKDGFLKYLITTHPGADNRKQKAIERIFLLVGPGVTKSILEFVGKKGAMSAYQPLLKIPLMFGPQSREAIEKCLNSGEPVTIRLALYLLGEIKARQSVEAIKPFLRYKDQRVQREAARSLVRIKSIESNLALMNALNKIDDHNLQLMIIQAMGESRDRAAVPGLIKLLKKYPLREDTVDILESIIDNLGRIGSREALPHLIKELNRFSLIKRDLSQRIKIRSAIALGRLGSESAVQALARYANKGDDELSSTATRVMEALIASDGKPVENIEEVVR